MSILIDTAFPALDNKGVRIYKESLKELCMSSDCITERLALLAEQRILIRVNLHNSSVCTVSMQRLASHYENYCDAIESDESTESSWIHYFFSCESDAIQAVLDFLSGMIICD